MKTLIELFQKRADVTCKLIKTTQTSHSNSMAQNPVFFSYNLHYREFLSKQEIMKITLSTPLLHNNDLYDMTL